MTPTVAKGWRTMNWLRVGGEVFMVQQKWKLYREKKKSRRGEYAYAALSPFPSEEWRIVPLNEMVDDESLRRLMEAREDE